MDADARIEQRDQFLGRYPRQLSKPDQLVCKLF